MRIIAKTYAAFSPAGEQCRLAVQEAGTAAVGASPPWLFLEGDLLRISWEGMFFPLDDVLEALTRCLPPGAEGRLDHLDLEAWTLTRCLFHRDADAKHGEFAVTTRSLNHVLDYSGH